MRFETIPVTRAEQNCSILWCEATRKAAIVDPGGDIHLLLDFMEWSGIEPELILLTHGHFDHAGGAARLAEMTGARIEGPHEGDAQLLAGMREQAASRGFKAEPVVPDRWLAHGDIVRFGEVEMEALHCPGHSRGHIAYVHRSTRWAFVGDILFRGAIGAWAHDGGDLRTLLTSIRERLLPLGDDMRFVPGHGPVSSFGEERATNPFVGDAAMAALTSQSSSPRVKPG